MTNKQPIKQILGSLLLLQIVSFGEVIINEISTKQTERAIRWDEKNQPFAGTWPAWWMNEFDNSQWKTGKTPIGYDLGNIRTNVKNIIHGVSPSLYVIKKFDVSNQDASSSKPLLLSINYNDGFIAWLNGKEIARANNGSKNAHIYWDQVSYRANSTSTRLTNIRLGLSDDYLIEAENTIAIQLNNHNPLTSLRLDFSIKIDETGAQDKVLVPTGSTVSYFPGLMEPSSGLYDPAIFENDDIKNENSDWIEIYNSGTSSVDLGSWSLSDNENIPDKWKFPEGTIILPDSYLVVLADELSEVIQSKHLHTNFKLSGDGEFLGLFDKDGNSRSAFNKKYPKQYNFYSYGISTDSGKEVYFR